MTDEYAPEALVRELLPRTWYAFFARFGRLTPIQRLAPAPIVAGRHTLVGAPTASGKTEAVLAPLLERVMAAPDFAAHGLRVLIISPTRALASDLERRLAAPLARCGVGLAKKTGDTPQLPSDLPAVLITTPESLDSMLCRRPRALRAVRGLFLDELHFLAETSRGDQLRSLLTRLDRVAADPPQRCGASATLLDAARLAALFLGEGAAVVTPDGPARRKLAITHVEAADFTAAAAAIAEHHRSGAAPKLLAFANARNAVETLAATLRSEPDLQPHVFAHHGSLARPERLRVEAAIHTSPRALCVATMTLEVGIDIGDIDAVALLGPPPDVSALLQRVGRANRGSDTTHVLALHATPFDRERLVHLAACAEAGRFHEEPIAFRPTLIAQQALSLLFQSPRGWVAPDAVHARLPPDARALWSEADVAAILAHMAAGPGLLRRLAGARYTAEPRATRLFEIGKLHSTLVDQPETEVVDALTGRLVGTVGPRAEGQSLALGGQRREIVAERDGRLFVTTEEGQDASRFLPREGPRYGRALARDLAAHLGVGEGVWPLLVDDEASEGAAVLGHFMGTLDGILLAEILVARDLTRRARPHAFFAPLAVGAARARARGLGSRAELAAIVARALGDRALPRLLRRLGPGALRDAVPEPLLRRWVDLSVDVAGLVDAAARAELTPTRTPWGADGA